MITVKSSVKVRSGNHAFTDENAQGFGYLLNRTFN